MLDTELIEKPKQAKENRRTQHAKPVGFVIGRRNRKIQKRAVFAPNAAVVASGHAKTVISRRKIRIFHTPLIDNFSPLLVLTVQLEAKMHPLWRDQTQCRVIDCQIAYTGRQTQTLLGIVFLTVRRDLLDVNRRWQLVERKMLGIDNTDAVRRREPQFSIRR
ncbi:MAG TPA: hypothetical protein VMI10_15160, partial [Terriglobales bacterium]|nr:hypothetical protein [Terriglobales bacterium]